MTSLFSNDQLDIIYLHIKELGSNFYDYIYRIWGTIKSSNNFLTKVYAEYIKETQEELFDSPKAIHEFYSETNNYGRLLKGEMGDNLLRKYTARVWLEGCEQLIEFAYQNLRESIEKDLTKEDMEALDAAMKWALAVRNINDLFDNEATDRVLTLSLSYDVKSWYENGFGTSPLRAFKKAVTYKIFYDKKRISNILGEGRNLHGDDRLFLLGRTLIHWRISDLWRVCHYAYSSPS